MIVRISTEGQYRLPSALLDEIDALDDRLVEAVAAGDEAQFRKLYDEMVSIVRQRGEPLRPDEIEESAIILPPPDITLADAKNLFIGAGLVPG